MEIHDAVKNSGDKRLQAKFEKAMKAIDRTLALYSYEGIAFSFNGGKDSTVLLHLLRAGFALAGDHASASSPSSSAAQAPPAPQPAEAQALQGEQGGQVPTSSSSFSPSSPNGATKLPPAGPQPDAAAAAPGDAAAAAAANVSTSSQAALGTSGGRSGGGIESASASAPLEHRISTIYFESPDAFPEIDSFTFATARQYELELEMMREDFKAGMQELMQRKPVKAVFLGTRISDPNAVGQEVFAPSSEGWPPFMRVNPILDWSYRDVWAFLLATKVPYCELYDHGYTSIGNVYDTLPNEALRIVKAADSTPPAQSSTPGTRGAADPATASPASARGSTADVDPAHGGGDEPASNGPAVRRQVAHAYRPAYMLKDGRLERAGRVSKKKAAQQQQQQQPAQGPSGERGPGLPADSDAANGLAPPGINGSALFSASIIVVGDEILRGEVEDARGQMLARGLRAHGWAVARRAIVPNDVDVISEEVQQRKNACDLVLVTGGVGPTHNDATMVAVAKAFGVRLAPDEELEEELRASLGPSCSPAQLKMALLPEGVTELIASPALVFPVVKCHNVVVLAGQSLAEVEEQWRVLVERGHSGRSALLHEHRPFSSARLQVVAPPADVADPMARVHRDYPDVAIGYYEGETPTPKGNHLERASSDHLVVTVDGKNESRVTLAAKALAAAFHDESNPSSPSVISTELRVDSL